jgi:hypothetical protein
MTAAALLIDERTLIPELLSRFPQARRVLDEYGLRGCGGPQGPVETIGFFARAHDVPLARLLDELRAAGSHADQSSAPAVAAASPAVSLADSIYRPFFLAGIAVVLTLGAVWGAYLLLQIGLRGTFAAAGLHAINAHGHAQIFGWVGLFVMGFAYQAFPRFKHTSLAHPRLAVATLVLMILGVAARSLAHPLASQTAWLWWVAVGGSAAEVAAIVLFAGIIVQTLRSSSQPLAHYDYYILAALGWFVVQGVYEGVYLTATLAVSGEELVQLVATWQAPLRDIQIHGFALLMILGVSQRAFHHFYGLPAPSAARSLALLPVICAAVVGEVAGLLLMRLIGPVWAALWYGSVIALAVATAALVAGWRIDAPAPDGDRTLKFLRIAYVWLFVSLGMLVVLPAYQAAVAQNSPASDAAQTGFSHAYYGAARHAITVGFISLMIVGVAAKVVPTLNGVDGRMLSALWAPFVLINAGCFLRVVGQILTDFTSLAFPIAGMSGLLEETGLAIWGGHLALVMAGRARLRTAVPIAPLPPLAGRDIDPADTVASVLSDEPRLLETFLAAGFTQLASPYARQTIARVVTLRQACQRLGKDVEPFVAELNAARRTRRALDLPLITNPNPTHERKPTCHAA